MATRMRSYLNAQKFCFVPIFEQNSEDDINVSENAAF